MRLRQWPRLTLAHRALVLAPPHPRKRTTADAGAAAAAAARSPDRKRLPCIQLYSVMTPLADSSICLQSTDKLTSGPSRAFLTSLQSSSSRLHPHTSASFMLSCLRTAHSVELEESELEDEDDELLPLLSEPFSPLLAGADAPPLTDAGLSLNNSKCHR